MDRVEADLARPDTLSVIPEGIEALVYAASPDRGDPEAYDRAYVRGLANSLDFFHQRGDAIRRVVLTTSTGIYPQHQGEWVDEDTPIDGPTPHRARSAPG